MITISLMQISVPLSDSLIPFLRGLRELCDCHLLEVELYSLQKDFTLAPYIRALVVWLSAASSQKEPHSDR